MSPTRVLLRKQHRPIDLQRVYVDEVQVYQALCACGRRAVPGSRKLTQQDQKDHRRLASVGVR